ncbi:BCCT family transporter, partial [Citrobacter sedlakii]|uniref:BCCT family transporter n=1 Tax=Citrobacter sedlakii TaxID=67826 RepID=UPI0033357E96
YRHGLPLTLRSALYPIIGERIYGPVGHAVDIFAVIGTVFGVAEPVMHYLSPPVGTPETVAAAKEAMRLTFFHWGLHAWAIYAIVALILAFFSYRHGLPLTLRSALYPIIGERIYGPVGHAVDIFAVIGTVFGVA